MRVGALAMHSRCAGRAWRSLLRRCCEMQPELRWQSLARRTAPLPTPAKAGSLGTDSTQATSDSSPRRCTCTTPRPLPPGGTPSEAKPLLRGRADRRAAGRANPARPAARAPASGPLSPRAAASATPSEPCTVGEAQRHRRAALAEPGAPWAPSAFSAHSLHLYAARPTESFKNGDMEATFMQISPVSPLMT